MKYNLNNIVQANEAKQYFNKLLANKKDIEIREIKETRSLSQNKYLHVCITLFGIEFGYTIEEAKTHLKRNCEFMRYEKKGEMYLKQTSKMDSKELTEFIEWLRNHASINGCYIPTSEEYLEQKFNIDREIDKFKKYL